jgi:hypothetical protein
MLHTLKSTPSPKEPRKGGTRKGERGRGNRRRGGAGIDCVANDDLDAASLAMDVGEYDGYYDAGDGRGDTVAWDRPVSGLESPVAQSVWRVAERLRMQSEAEPSLPQEPTPMLLLPYFKHLNDEARMSLMRQLIERFQRTSFTPKGAFMLPTPRFGDGLGGGLDSDAMTMDLLGSPRFLGVDPNCFEVIDMDGFGVGAGNRSVRGGSSSSSSMSRLPSPLAAAMANGLGGNVGGGGGPMSARKKSNGAQGGPESTFSAVDTAVAIALQVVAKTAAGDQMMRVLLGEEASPRPNYSSNDPERSLSSILERNNSNGSTISIITTNGSGIGVGSSSSSSNAAGDNKDVFVVPFLPNRGYTNASNASATTSPQTSPRASPRAAASAVTSPTPTSTRGKRLEEAAV